MKEYMKNKNFIPEKFYNRMEIKRNKIENSIISIFLIINLILIPNTVKYLYEIKDADISTVKINTIENQNIVDLNDVNIWLEKIANDDIQEAYINNNCGEVLVDDLNKIDELTSSKLVKIENVNLIDDEKYKLGVSLNE